MGPKNTVRPVFETFPRQRAMLETGIQTRSETHFRVPKTPCAPCLKLFPGSGRDYGKTSKFRENSVQIWQEGKTMGRLREDYRKTTRRLREDYIDYRKSAPEFRENSSKISSGQEGTMGRLREEYGNTTGRPREDREFRQNFVRIPSKFGRQGRLWEDYEKTTAR